MAKITAEQQKELAYLARAANRRIERADAGQRASIERSIRNYHIRDRNGMAVFKQGKAKTEAEYKARMRELQIFMSARSTTRKGWKEIKSENVKKAGETLRDQGANITDEELQNVLEETGGASGADFYKALANVEIAKERAGESWKVTKENIRNAINERRTAMERAMALIEARNKK